ncbi:hypothetical protein WIX39_026270 [Variovorax sp. AB1(2024)]|uniref:hypothetical protein n=1 Tax=Variovorax sp. AB1(2024) TaxID=3132214 RepID=UPI0030B5746C
MASKYKKGQISYDFAAVPSLVLRSAEWNSLPPNAQKLAFNLMAQYTGKNNGRLCPAFEAVKDFGCPGNWKSETTLIAAKRALLEASFVVHTRQGHAPRTSDWIGFTWWRLDWEKSMDIEPRGFPYLNFLPLPKGAPKTLPALQKLEVNPSKQAPGPTETVVRGQVETVL